MTQDVTGLILGLGLAAVVAGLAIFGLRGHRYRCSQTCRFACPRFGTEVECELVQDVRTGQWRELRSCSRFPRLEEVTCGRECAGRLNLGLRLGGWKQQTSGLWLLRPSA